MTKHSNLFLLDIHQTVCALWQIIREMPSEYFLVVVVVVSVLAYYSDNFVQFLLKSTVSFVKFVFEKSKSKKRPGLAHF